MRSAARLGLVGMLMAVSACNSSIADSSQDSQLIGIPVSVDFRPEVHGFSFPNFNADRYAPSFDLAALRQIVGSGPRVCADGIADPCEVTSEAAEFIGLVEAARSAGHCEGLVVLAALRYDWGLEPVTSQLAPDDRVISAIIAAFATIFLPEVQAEARSWISTSLADTVEVLATALSEGTLDFGMGIYRPDGGHEVLPYAISYPREGLARISVYDSNWPGVERFVDIDLTNETWRFSFAGDDPETDPHAWTGGHEDLDLNSISVRIAALEARGVVVAPPGA